jgi:putative oxidoreductase
VSSRFPVNLIDNKYLPFFSRVILGGIFIYAAAGKILYPAEFSEAITNYQLVPVMFTNLVAIILPWVELVAGLLLINGFRTQSGNLIIFLLICIFSFGAFSALIRGLDINCGCFTEASRRVGLIFLAEEAALFLMSIYIFFFDKGFLSIDNLLSKHYSS